MHLACPECNAPVEVNASFSNCPNCGADIASHYTIADVSRAVYQSAVERYSRGNELAALERIRHGLAILDAPELHLLAAIIHHKRGEFSDMRRHVAAIPMNDSLRPEGEWLIRSHQERLQKNRRKAARKRGRASKGNQLLVVVGKANRQFTPESYPLSVSGNDKPTNKIRRKRLLWAIPITATLLAILLFTQVEPLRTALRQLRNTPPELISSYILTQDSPILGTTPTAIAENPLPPVPIKRPREVMVREVAAVSSAPEPTPTQTPTRPELASERSPGAVVTAIVATVQAQSFDLTSYLNGRNRPDLAALPVQARLQGSELTLQGVVSLTSHRLDLLTLALQADGVAWVNGIDLVVHLPQTYTVQEGDNLHIIAYKLYGDRTRWEDIYAANQTLISQNGNFIQVGEELIVP